MNEIYTTGVEPQKGLIPPKANTEFDEDFRRESKISLAASEGKGGYLGKVKFTKKADEAAVESGTVDVAFAAMAKEELMKYANDLFWIRLHWTLFVLFWNLWIVLAVAIVLAPIYHAPAPLE